MRCLVFEKSVVGQQPEERRLVSGRAGTCLCDEETLRVEELLERLDISATIPELVVFGERCE